jgi:hypothetical protein
LIINDKTTLVLSASSSLLKLLVNGIPELVEESVPASAPALGTAPDSPIEADSKGATISDKVEARSEASTDGESESGGSK